MSAPEPSPSVKCRVLLLDDSFVVLAKDVGVPSEPGAGHQSDTIMNGAFALWQSDLAQLGEDRDWGLVHRLDRMASGCLVIARTRSAYDSLRGQFAARTVGKAYLAVVTGRLPSAVGTCDEPIREERRGNMKIAVIGPRGDSARTDWKTLGRSGTHSLLEVCISTGRLHQIRAHMAHLGAPLVGEHIYRPLLPPNTSAASGGDKDLLLHAWRLEFLHPVTRTPVKVTAPLPNRFRDSAGKLLPRECIPL